MGGVGGGGVGCVVGGRGGVVKDRCEPCGREHIFERQCHATQGFRPA